MIVRRMKTTSITTLPRGFGQCIRTRGRIIPRQIQPGLASRTFTSTRIACDAISSQPIASSSKNEGIAQEEVPSASIDLLEYYRSLVASGRLKWDDEQVRVIMKLRHLQIELQTYKPPLDLLSRLTPSSPVRAKRAMAEERERESGGSSWWGKGKSIVFGRGSSGEEVERGLVRVLSGEEELENLQTPKGVMITGPPGTGKSLLLTQFFNLLPTTHKKRWHYHAFTLHLYRRVFQEMNRRRSRTTDARRDVNMDVAANKGWRAVFAGGRWDGEGIDGGEREDGIPFVIARDMILEYHVLYFDELQLLDASSAALLRDVMTWYWRLGGVIVTCSNRVPEDLYHHGVQKDRMSSFLDSLKARCEVIELDGGRDWRRGVDDSEEASTPRDTWYGEGSKEFEDTWEMAVEGREVSPRTISVYGRKVRVPLAAGSVARFNFADLCEEALGAADYISLASSFSTIFIDAVPILYLKNKNEARRLINLIDALYESRCQLVISATTTPEEMFFPDALTRGQGEDDNATIMAAESFSESLHLPAMPNISVYNPETRAQREKREEKEGRVASAFGVLGIWTGEDERFAYKRAVSRMIEMTRSPTYAKEDWIPLDPSGRAWESSIASPSSSSTSFPTSASHHTYKPPPHTTPPPTLLPDNSPRLDPKDMTDEFATEAGYSRPSRLRQRHPDERGPPVIQEHHVWGVEDGWGEKAGRWGKGVGVFEKVDGERKGRE